MTQPLPQRIMLDDESFAAFSAEVENPGPPNAALIALFKPSRLLIVVALLLAACGPSARSRMIKSTFVSVNALRDGFIEWDAHHQERVIAEAKSFNEGKAELDKYRREREPIVDGFAGVYHALAAATLVSDDPKNLARLLSAAQELEQAIATFKKLEEAPHE
jgi:hypothetical protein